MAITPFKTFIAGEVLTASDLNSSFNQIINNGIALWSPATTSVDLDGNEIVLDGDADSSITADTDDRIDFRLSGQDLFRFDGTATSPVNGLDFIASATGSDVQIQAIGTDTNIDIDIKPKGSGNVLFNSATILTGIVQDTTPQLGGQLDVNGQAIGDGTRELLTFTEDASAVNHVDIENQATGGGPIIRAAGDDTNVPLLLQGKGTGAVQIGDANLQFPDADGSANAFLATDGSAGLSFVDPATQAEQETATSTAKPITPGRQQYHPSAAKFWVIFQADTTVDASYNVTSITDNGTGDFTVTIATNFSSTNWSPYALCEQTANSLAPSIKQSGVAAGTVNILSQRLSTGAAEDPTRISAGGFGDQ